MDVVEEQEPTQFGLPAIDRPAKPALERRLHAPRETVLQQNPLELRVERAVRSAAAFVLVVRAQHEAERTRPDCRRKDDKLADLHSLLSRRSFANGLVAAREVSCDTKQTGLPLVAGPGGLANSNLYSKLRVMCRTPSAQRMDRHGTPRSNVVANCRSDNYLQKSNWNTRREAARPKHRRQLISFVCR